MRPGDRPGGLGLAEALRGDRSPARRVRRQLHRRGVAQEPVPKARRTGQPVPRGTRPAFVEHRRHRVVVLAWQVDLHLGDLAPSGDRQGQRVDLRAPDHPVLVIGESLVEATHHGRSVSHEVILPRHYDISASRQWPHLRGQRLPGQPPHHHGVAQGQLLEPRLVLGQPPRDAVVAADHTRAGLGPDQPDRPRHTATGALIAGCGS